MQRSDTPISQDGSAAGHAVDPRPGGQSAATGPVGGDRATQAVSCITPYRCPDSPIPKTVLMPSAHQASVVNEQGASSKR